MSTFKHFAAAAAVAVAGLAVSGQEAAAAEPINICAGSEKGNYTFSANAMARVISGDSLNVIHTAGSWDNIQKLRSGECDAAIVQEDAVIKAERQSNLPLEPLLELYPEAFHMICGKDSDVDELKDLINATATIALGDAGSGPWVTWSNIKEADERYGTVVTDPTDGRRAASKVSQGLMDCFLMISGVGSASLNELDERYGQDTTLVQVRDGDVQDIVGMNGRDPLYHRVTIEEGTYTNWTPEAFFGDNSVSTIAVMAKLVANTDRLTDDQLENLQIAGEDALAAIHDRVGYRPN